MTSPSRIVIWWPFFQAISPLCSSHLVVENRCLDNIVSDVVHPGCAV